jgi:hypothetical protein
VSNSSLGQLNSSIIEDYFVSQQHLMEEAPELQETIRDYINRFYNPIRIRSNGKTPIQSEREYNQLLAQRCA